MNVFVDTPVWSLALRRRAGEMSAIEIALRQELAELIREGRAMLLGPIRQEVLTGIRDAAQFEKLKGHLRAFPNEPLTTGDYEHAALFNNQCRRAGVAGSAIDFLLCAAAERRKAAIFTTDQDFARFGRHLPVHLHHPRSPKS